MNLTLFVFGSVALLVLIHIGAICGAVGAHRKLEAWAECKRRLAERRLRASNATMAARVLRRVA